jgi:hypothetical protein
MIFFTIKPLLDSIFLFWAFPAAKDLQVLRSRTGLSALMFLGVSGASAGAAQKHTASIPNAFRIVAFFLR